jgi:hypothetical protein
MINSISFLNCIPGIFLNKKTGKIVENKICPICNRMSGHSGIIHYRRKRKIVLYLHEIPLYENKLPNEEFILEQDQRGDYEFFIR